VSLSGRLVKGCLKCQASNHCYSTFQFCFLFSVNCVSLSFLLRNIIITFPIIIVFCILFTIVKCRLIALVNFRWTAVNFITGTHCYFKTNVYYCHVKVLISTTHLLCWFIKSFISEKLNIFCYLLYSVYLVCISYVLFVRRRRKLLFCCFHNHNFPVNLLFVYRPKNFPVFMSLFI